MKARFRVRQGDEELQVETLQDFEALVRSGVIDEGDVVHDALTGQWAPARAHPVYQLVREAMGDRDVTREEAGAPEESGDLGFAMELVEEEERSAEDETRAFIEEMERERREDPDRAALGDDVELFDGMTAASLTSPPLPDEPRKEPPGERGEERGAEPRPGEPPPPSSGPRAAVASPASSSGSPQDPSREQAPATGGRRRAVAILGFALLALGVTAAVAHPAFRFQDTLPSSEDAPRPGARRAAPPSDTELRADAHASFLDGVDSLRGTFDLGRVPRAWLEGRYLAEASAHPEVGRFWTDYLRYVEQVHGEEDVFYREAYLAALEEGGVGGPVRSLRLARATADFQARAPERHEVYAQLWELAVAARSLHELLVEMEGDITWEPARSERLSADPVTEAVGRDAETQARLDEALDRVLRALYQVTDGGRDIHGQEPDWLARGLSGVDAGDGGARPPR